jgi:hypothetical protein
MTVTAILPVVERPCLVAVTGVGPVAFFPAAMV